ncbi:hypothetical protein [uncultured Methanobrevibacter sp.]|uniref:hypothetical protein n=1 Tax=uncultured Methanobrevibacter sp. TaxID=253161 RepID=UPI0025F427B5|nr:hypothetical protein [uncultured Methanobrevibacter sp.]
MSEYSYNTILAKARSIKKNVSKKQNLGEGSKWGYYIAKAIMTPKTPIKRISFDGAPNPQGDSLKIEINKNDYMSLVNYLIRFVENKEYKRLPNFLKYNGKKIRVRDYVWLFSKLLVYKHDFGKYPSKLNEDSSVFVKKVQCKSPYVSSPHWTNQGAGYLGQITPYHCGPHSIRQSIKKFGINISESTLASWAGTTTSGTDHEGINTAIAKAAKEAGVKIDVEWVNFSSLGFKALGELLCQPNVAAFLHILYSGVGEYYDPDDECGHYEYCNRVNTATKYVQALNSLGSRDGYGYYGHLQDRSFNLQERYISGISQKSVCILRLRK